MAMTKDEQIKTLTQEVQDLKEQVTYLTAKMFGRKSERVDPNQLSLLEDSQRVFTSPEQTGHQSENPIDQVRRPRQSKTPRQATISQTLPVFAKKKVLEAYLPWNQNQITQQPKLVA